MIVKNDDKTPSETNRRKKLKMIILIVIVLLLAGGITMCKIMTRDKGVEIEAGDFLPAGKDATKAEKKKAAAAKVDASNFTLSVYPEAVFPKGAKEKGTLHVRNDETNAYPINVKIRVDNTNQVVYESGAIQPGYEIYNVPLDVTLETGEYKATAEVDIYDAKSKEKQGSAQAALVLTIKWWYLRTDVSRHIIVWNGESYSNLFSQTWFL